MNNRAFALDALRGYAIITMVLSATIAMGILPAWMYHAQVPPPAHEFNPNLPGLTWVDLVFPSFLFAMGAAFPFSIRKRYEKGESKLKLVVDALIRGALLTFFAIFIQHFYPYMLGNPQNMRSWLLAIACFVLLFPIFMRIPISMPSWAHWAVKLGAIAVAVVMLLNAEYANGHTFDMHTSNIIILILANMAVFGSLLYIFTMHSVNARIGVLMLLIALMLASTISGSWAEAVARYSPVTWFYNFNYLKYLIIIVSGSIAGEHLAEWMSTRNVSSIKSEDKGNNTKALIMIVVTLAFVIINLYCLYMRYVLLNMVLNAVLIIIGLLTLRHAKATAQLWKKLFVAGAFLLALGLLIEPFEGGIKKDPVTFSYLFTTSGLSFMTLIFFSVICDYYNCHKSTAFLVMTGQNPMIAYVAGDLLLMPLAGILGVASLLYLFSANVWLGFLQGVILTTLSVLVTMYFTKIKWFWRT